MKLILISYVELRKPKPIFHFDAAFKVCIYIYFQMCIAKFSNNELMLLSLWNVSSWSVKQLHRILKLVILKCQSKHVLTTSSLCYIKA